MKRSITAIFIASATALGVHAQTLSVGNAVTSTNASATIVVTPPQSVVIETSKPVVVSSGTNRVSATSSPVVQSRPVVIIPPTASTSVSTGGAPKVMRPVVIAPAQPRVMSPTVIAPALTVTPGPAIATNAPTTAGKTNAAAGDTKKGGFMSRLFRRTEEAKDPEPLKLTPSKHRITDFQIANDHLFFEEWQRRIDQSAAAAKGLKLYHLAKASAWLDFTRTEYAAHPHSPMIERTFAQATNLVMRVEDGEKGMSLETPQIVECSRVRPDLWARIAELKREMNFGRGIVEVAWLEVQLIKACHVSHTKGWLAAKGEFARAESWAAISWSRISDKPMPASAPEFNQLPPLTLEAFPAKARDQAAALELMEKRIGQIHNLGVAVTDYRLASAAEWLRFATSAHASRNKSGIVQEIGAECLRRIRAIESGASETAPAPVIIGGAKAVRPDLWEAVVAAQQNGDAAVGGLVAEAEAELTRAALKTRQFGRRAAEPFIDRAKDLLARIREAEFQEMAALRSNAKP